jgi:hypothetical protein
MTITLALLKKVFSMPCVKGKTRYSVAGKQEIPMSLAQFKEHMTTGKFVKQSHRAFAVGTYYFGLRKTELRLTLKEQITTQGDYLVFDVGERLKHSSETDPLKIKLDAPFLNELLAQVNSVGDGSRVFNFSDKTAYNIMRRAGFFYPHYCRLSRITNLFDSGKTIAEVKSFTGLSLKALDYYVGKVALLKIADSLGKEN